jgi:MFS family permease
MGGVEPTNVFEAAPTRVRFGVLAFLCALSFVLYIDRICISQAAESMQADLGLSKSQMGIVFSSFTLAYVLFEVPTGRLGDRYGSRPVLIRIVLWWSAFTALTGCVWRFEVGTDWGVGLPSFLVMETGEPGERSVLYNSLLLLILIRFLFGAGEAGALPNTARVLSRWFPGGRRGPAQGMINTAMLVGGTVAPIAAAYLIKDLGWRWAFVIFGSLGLVWVATFAAWFRDDPASHPGVNGAELALIRGSGSVAETGHDAPIPWRLVLHSRNVWLLGAIMSCMAFLTYMFYFWYPSYLQNARAVGEVTSGWLAGLVLTGGAIGSTLGGYLADWLARRMGERRRSLRVQGVCGLTLGAVFLVAGVACDEVLSATAFTSLACFSVALTVAGWWAAVTEISGSHLGALFGLMNSLGGFGAISSPIFLGFFVDWRARHGYEGRQQWDPAFYLYALVLLVGAAGWLLVDTGRSAVEDEPDTV